MKECRDGCEIFIKGKLSRFTKNQRVPTDPAEFEMIKKNLYKVLIRSYITGGTLLSLIALFCVPKGEDDIRLVYYLTASGLNDALWYPTFLMTFVDNVLDVATHSSWFRDIYAAEMFHNYNISKICNRNTQVLKCTGWIRGMRHAGKGGPGWPRA